MNDTGDLYNVSIHQQDRCTIKMEELRLIWGGILYAAEVMEEEWKWSSYFSIKNQKEKKLGKKKKKKPNCSLSTNACFLTRLSYMHSPHNLMQ